MQEQLPIDITMTQVESLGQVKIAPEVIETITKITVSHMDEIAHIQNNFAQGMIAKLSKQSQNKGINITFNGESVLVDVDIVIYYGVDVPSLVEKLQTNIKQSIVNMTDLHVKEINVHVVGVEKKPTEDNIAKESNK